MRMRSAVFTFFSVILCAILFSLSLLASSNADEVYVIADFEDSEDGFFAGANSDSVHITDASFSDDRRTCLSVDCAYRYASIIRSAEYIPETPLDLTEYRTFKYDIYAPVYEHDENALYYTRLTLFSEDGTTNYSLAPINGGQWNTVTADMGDFDGRGAIVKAEIALLVDTPVKKITTNGFYIDSVCATGLVDREMMNRFLFDTYTVTGARATVERGKTAIVMTSGRAEPVSLKADMLMPKKPYPANTLRIYLENMTNSTSMVLHYTTLDSRAISEDKSVVIKIEPNSGGRYYYAPVGDASTLRGIELLFGDGDGVIRLISVSAVWKNESEEYMACGRITSAKLDGTGSSVRVVGEINRDTAIAYKDSKIAIYRWNGDELPTAEELALAAPTVESPMTVRFELIVPVKNDDPASRYSRYIAVIRHDDSEYTLIAPPFCASDQHMGAAEMGSFQPDVKAMSSEDLSLICDADCELTVLEVDMKAAFVKKSDSEPYIFDGCVYYPSAEYFKNLNDKIRLLSDTGVSVLLRVTGWDSEYERELTERYAADDYVLSQRLSALPDGTDYFEALAEYTAGRWASGGGVSGVILGKCENYPTSDGASLGKQTENTAKQLHALYASYISKNADAKIYLSVSDLFNADAINNSSEYVLYEYLPAMIDAAREYGEFQWELCVEVSDDKDETYEYAEITDCENLFSLLSAKDMADRHVIFCDSIYTSTEPRLSTLMESYVLGYLKSYFDSRVDAYIADVDSRGTMICDTIKNIDTEDGEDSRKSVLMSLKEKRFEDIIYGYDEDELPHKKISLSKASFERPDDVRGEFAYFDFGSASGLSDMWYGCYAENITITNDGGAVMRVQLDRKAYGAGTRMAWGGIAHRFAHTENMKNTPIIRLTVKFDGVVPSTLAEVPLKMVLTSENERFESTAEVPVGEWVILYFDISDFGGIKNTETIGIYAGESRISSAEMSIGSIQGLSLDLGDEALAKAVFAERIKKLSPEERADNTLYYWIGGGVLIVVATVLVFVLLSRRKDDDDD